MDLPRTWFSPGGNDALWGNEGTYQRVRWESLPPVGPLDGSFSWLRAARAPQYGMRYDYQSDRQPEALVRPRIEEAERLGLAVPPELARFLTDPDLFGRVPSCTACYWDVGSRLVPVPGREGPARLLRFMNDQQAVLLWYVLLEPGAHRVACAWPSFRGDAPPGATLEEAADPMDVVVCASSFEELVKRFWIENTLWFAHHDGGQVSSELAAYAEAARRARAR